MWSIEDIKEMNEREANRQQELLRIREEMRHELGSQILMGAIAQSFKESIRDGDKVEGPPPAEQE